MKSEKEKKEQEELQKLIEEEKYALIEQVKFLKRVGSVSLVTNESLTNSPT